MCPLPGSWALFSLKSDRTPPALPFKQKSRLLLLFHNPKFPWLLFFPLLKGFCFSPFSQNSESIRCISNVKDFLAGAPDGQEWSPGPLHRWSWPVRPCTTQDHGRAMILSNLSSGCQAWQYNAWHISELKTTPRTHHSRHLTLRLKLPKLQHPWNSSLSFSWSSDLNFLFCEANPWGLVTELSPLFNFKATWCIYLYHGQGYKLLRGQKEP